MGRSHFQLYSKIILDRFRLDTNFLCNITLYVKFKNIKVNHKERKIATKIDLRQKSVCSEQNITPVLKNFTQPLVAMVVTFSMSAWLKWSNNDMKF